LHCQACNSFHLSSKHISRSHKHCNLRVFEGKRFANVCWICRQFPYWSCIVLCLTNWQTIGLIAGWAGDKDAKVECGHAKGLVLWLSVWFWLGDVSVIGVTKCISTEDIVGTSPFCQQQRGAHKVFDKLCASRECATMPQQYPRGLQGGKI